MGSRHIPNLRHISVTLGSCALQKETDRKTCLDPIVLGLGCYLRDTPPPFSSHRRIFRFELAETIPELGQLKFSQYTIDHLLGCLDR